MQVFCKQFNFEVNMDNNEIWGIDTKATTNNLWVLTKRFRAYKHWDTGFDFSHYYNIQITLVSKDTYLTEDKVYTGKDAIRMLKPEYIASAKTYIGDRIAAQCNIYSNWMHSVIDIQPTTSVTSQNSEGAAR